MKRYSGGNDKTVMFVQECKKSYSGVNGYRQDALNQLLRSFRQLKSDGYRFVFGNLVDEILPAGKKPTKTIIAEHVEKFLRTFRRIEPKYMIPLGATVTGFILPGKGKFTSLVGRRFDVAGFNVIPVYHPDYATKSKQRQREYETQIRSVVNQIAGSSEKVQRCDYRLRTRPEEIIGRLHALSQMTGTVQSFDWETTALDPEKGQLVCLSISHKERQGECFYFFCRSDPSYRMAAISNALRDWLTSPVPKVAHNAKFEIKWSIHHLGVEPANVVGDTQQMHHLIDENVRHRLSDLAYIYTDMGGYDMPMEEFLNKGHEHHEAESEFMLPYSAGDSDCTLRLYNTFRRIIDKDVGFRWMERNIVNPTVLTLARVETRGMKVNYDTVDKVEKIVKRDIAKIQEKINGFREVKRTLKLFQEKNPKLEEINLNSSKQMQRLLFHECRLPILEKSKKTGQPSTEKDVLEQLKDKHPIVEYIIRVRHNEHQLIEIEELRAKRSRNDTVYSDMIQDYVVTGRLSSRNPNLQNITGGSRVKECFESRFADGVIVQADYDQLELRLIGSESGDKNYMTVFERKLDPHGYTASQIFNKALENVTKKERDKGKRINFGVVYGITKYGLSKQLNITENEADELLHRYWDKYQSVRRWMNKNKAEALKNLAVRSRLGRRRQLPDIASLKWWVRESAERSSSNFKIQSLGADLTMWSFTNVDSELVKRQFESMVIGQIHDSILIDTKKEELRRVADVLKEVMVERAMRKFCFLRVPLSISIETGRRWSDLKELSL